MYLLKDPGQKNGATGRDVSQLRMLRPGGACLGQLETGSLGLKPGLRLPLRWSLHRARGPPLRVLPLHSASLHLSLQVSPLVQTFHRPPACLPSPRAPEAAASRGLPAVLTGCALRGRLSGSRPARSPAPGARGSPAALGRVPALVFKAFLLPTAP